MPSAEPAAVGTRVFLPGAGGRMSFWGPVAGRLRDLGPAWCGGYPGFGDEPPDPAVRSLDGLYDWLLTRLPAGSWDLIAQSMGGVLAARLAIEHPERVRRLVLVATSGGLDLVGMGAQDWRPAYLAAADSLPTWFADDRTDLGPALPTIRTETLVITGDRDPISPPTVARRLAALIPGCRTIVVPADAHDFAHLMPEPVAAAIRGHLTAR